MLQHVTYISSESCVCILVLRFLLANGGTLSNEIKNAKLKLIHDKKNPAVN